MYSPLRYITSIFWKRRPLQLTFFITSRCNSRCPFCFYLKGKTRKKTEDELTLREIRKVSRSIGRLLWILFSGGEPYLRDDLVEISRTFYENNKPSILTYPTNGLLPELIRDRTERILRACKKSTVVVKISLDGLYSEHDNLRGVKGNFKRAMETYELLLALSRKYSNFEIGINTVFCSLNQRKAKEIISFVSGLEGVNAHTFSIVRGDLKNSYFKDIDLSLYREAMGLMKKNLREGRIGRYRFSGSRLKSAQDILRHRLIYRTMSEDRRVIPCYAGTLNAVMDETGNIYPCEILGDKIGNIREGDYDFMRIYNSEKGKRIRAKIARGKCYCSHECYFTTNILFNPLIYPSLIREYVQL